MTRPKNPVDRRPFRSRVELEREQALEARYHRVAIPEVVAAARQVAGTPWTGSANEKRTRPAARGASKRR